MVLETIGAAGVIFKAKYVKRTGGPGNYKYWYRNPKTGKLQAGKQPAKKPTKESTDHILTRRSVYTGREIKPSKKPSKVIIALHKERALNKKRREAQIGRIPDKELNLIRDEREELSGSIGRKYEEKKKEITRKRENLDREEYAMITQHRKEAEEVWEKYSDKHAKLLQKYKPKYEIE